MSTTARLLACVAALLLAGAEAPAPALNPTVAVLANPTGAVPSDCATGQAVAAPRVTLDDLAGAGAVSETAAPEAPPQSRLQAALRRVQNAAERNDRDAFVPALAEAKSAAAAYPPGGEKTAAEATLRLYDDLSRLWDYSYSSKTGAFFEPGELLTMLRKYQGYDAAVADNLLVAGGRTLYPTAESRAFLVGEAARRLTGGRASAVALRRPAFRKIPNAPEAETPKPTVPSSGGHEAAKRHETPTSTPKAAKVESARSGTHAPKPSTRKPGNSATDKPNKPLPEKSAPSHPLAPVTTATKPAPVTTSTTKLAPVTPAAPSTSTHSQTATTAPAPARPAPAPAPATTRTTSASSPPSPGTQTATAPPAVTVSQHATTDTATPTATTTTIATTTASTTASTTATTTAAPTATDTGSTTSTSPAPTSVSAPPAADTNVTETTATENPQPAAEGQERNNAKLAIAVLLIVAALAFLIYLFRSGD